MRRIVKTCIHLSAALILLLTGCQSSEKQVDKNPWPKIIKELQLVEAGSQPDSIKTQRIKQIFNEYQISQQDYQEFYRIYAEEKPGKSLKLLRVVEDSLSVDIQRSRDTSAYKWRKQKDILQEKRQRKERK